jgi:hypothetical protein
VTPTTSMPPALSRPPSFSPLTTAPLHPSPERQEQRACEAPSPLRPDDPAVPGRRGAHSVDEDGIPWVRWTRPAVCRLYNRRRVPECQTQPTTSLQQSLHNHSPHRLPDRARASPSAFSLVSRHAIAETWLEKLDSTEKHPVPRSPSALTSFDTTLRRDSIPLRNAVICDIESGPTLWSAARSLQLCSALTHNQTLYTSSSNPERSWPLLQPEKLKWRLLQVRCACMDSCPKFSCDQDANENGMLIQGRDPAQKAMRPPLAGTPAPTRPSAKETPVPVPKPGSMPSLPTPAPQPTPDAPSLPNDVPALAPAPAPGVPAFSVLAPADANLQDVTSGPHRDGRIRNPVPSKLKGKTDGSKGNFSVMHMDVGVKGEATERDAQAKRTSESTALAAQRAYENGYVALRRSRFVHVPDEPGDEPPPPPPVPTPYVPPPPPAPAASTTVSTRRSTLNPAETKSEQARLLTLLRSLHPVLVVDQMCKALAFFGGIPGAPPPADGCFPQSAEANGPGSLFVGWVAEIFPKLGGNTSQREASPVRQLDGPVKRGRGRPKGSKATKARKDKGIKKGPVKRPPTGSEPTPPPPMQGDESWLDVDETVVGGPAEGDASVMLLAQATNSSPPRQLPTLAGASQQAAGQELISQATNAVNRAALLGSDAVNASPTSAKRRGRPKGSKNRPKLPDDAPGENGNSLATPAQVPQPDHAPQPVSSAPQVPRALEGSQVLDGLPAFMPATSTLPTSVKKTNQGKGATVRQPPGGVVEPARAQETPVPVPVPRAASGSNARPGYAQPTASQQPTHQPSPALSTMPVQPSPGLYPPSAGQGNTPLAAQKRKRKGGKEAETLSVGGPVQVHGLNPANQENTHKLGLTIGVSASQPPPAAAARPPLAKRQKKVQDVKPLPELSNAYLTTAPVSTSAPVSEIAEPSTTPSSRPVSTQNPVATRVPEPAHRQPSPSPTSAMASPQSPHHGHFEVQSPTMENYEAQLQAQLEQQSEPVSQPVSTQSHVSSAQLAPARIQQQQPDFSRRQQQQQQMSTQSRSPNPQVPQSTTSQSASPMLAQQQTQSLQTPYSQYRAGNNQYAQQHQQQQQSYASSQSQPAQSQSPFAAPQQVSQASAQPTQKQQYTPKPQQPQQPYTSSQQSYSTAQQYSNNQHQLASQQRYQQQLSGSTSTNTVSYAAHHSPQFNPSTNPAFTPADSSYRPPPQPRNVASYTSQRSQSSTPTSASAYRTTNGSSSSTGQQQQQQGLATHHAASFAPNASATQQRSGATANQGMQGMATSFAAGGNATDWSMFDTGSLDNDQGGLGGMNDGNYGMGGSAGVRASSNAGARFSSSSMGGYEASGLPYGQ